MSKIMTVDDAAFMRMTVKNILNKEGYTDIVEACSGEDAVTKYAVEKPDLVLLDITMPIMDGLQALKNIRAINPKAKVVMCSAMGQESMVIDAIQSGAIDFIVKPFKPDRLLQTVKKIIP